jgi:hypothetical protein
MLQHGAPHHRLQGNGILIHGDIISHFPFCRCLDGFSHWSAECSNPKFAWRAFGGYVAMCKFSSNNDENDGREIWSSSLLAIGESPARI